MSTVVAGIVGVLAGAALVGLVLYLRRRAASDLAQTLTPVSYTHLTLPTIYSV